MIYKMSRWKSKADRKEATKMSNLQTVCILPVRKQTTRTLFILSLLCGDTTQDGSSVQWPFGRGEEQWNNTNSTQFTLCDYLFGGWGRVQPPHLSTRWLTAHAYSKLFTLRHKSPRLTTGDKLKKPQRTQMNETPHFRVPSQTNSSSLIHNIDKNKQSALSQQTPPVAGIVQFTLAGRCSHSPLPRSSTSAKQ